MKNRYIIEGDTTRIVLKNSKSNEIFETLIDTSDLEIAKSINTSWCAKYHKNIQGYYAVTGKTRRKNGTGNTETFLLHRLIMGVENRYQIVDHIDHNTLDNRKSNLRILTSAQNSINRQGANKNTKSGVRNVSWSKTERKWLVQFQVNKKNTLFGRFNEQDKDMAIKLANDLRSKLYKL